MPTAASFHVVGVDGPAGNGGNRVLELGRLVQAVGVQADGHVVRVGEPERGVDQLGRRAVVLVDLEADRAGIEQDLEFRGVHRPGIRLEPDVAPGSPRGRAGSAPCAQAAR